MAFLKEFLAFGFSNRKKLKCYELCNFIIHIWNKHFHCMMISVIYKHNPLCILAFPRFHRDLEPPCKQAREDSLPLVRYNTALVWTLFRTTPFEGRASLCHRDAFAGRTDRKCSLSGGQLEPPTPTPPRETPRVSFFLKTSNHVLFRSAWMESVRAARWQDDDTLPRLGLAGHMLPWSLWERAAGELLSVTGDSSTALPTYWHAGLPPQACLTRARRTR